MFVNQKHANLAIRFQVGTCMRMTNCKEMDAELNSECENELFQVIGEISLGCSVRPCALVGFVFSALRKDSS